MIMEGDLTWGGEHTIQYTDDVLWSCTPESHIILLTSVTQINSIKKKKKKWTPSQFGISQQHLKKRV